MVRAVRPPAASYAHNLPAPATALVGRSQEVARIRQLVLQPEGRLVTLTGVGGCGKTRLALTVASQLVDSFEDGVWLVTLAPLADPARMPSAVASVLGVRERPHQSLMDGLIARLSRRQLLLVLDNCEHLAQACAELAAALLEACAGLHVLATSREPLHIAGEVAWRVPPLRFPEAPKSMPAEELRKYPAVQLFEERAIAVHTDFTLTPRAAPTVATICARLEGIPLAIELAAAWVRALGVDGILERLEDMFALLVGGNRAAPGRLQTMRAALDWSYGLLAPSERVVLQRLSTFHGGWTLKAAEIVCSGNKIDPHEMLIFLTRLVDTSLVQVDERDEQIRYRLLEPVRQYAHGVLVDSGELALIRLRHANYFMSYAEQRLIEATMGGPSREAAHSAIDRERDNLRAALEWCLDERDAEMGLRLCRAHETFWALRSQNTEARAWLNRLLLLLDADDKPSMRAVALTMLGGLSWAQGSSAQAQEFFAEALPLLRKSDETWQLASALTGLAFVASHRGDFKAADAYLEEALPAWRATGDQANVSICLQSMAWMAWHQEAYARARALCEDSAALARAVGDAWALSQSLTTLGHTMVSQGDLVAARPVLEDAVAIHRQLGGPFFVAHGLDALGRLATADGHHNEAQSALHESLRLRCDLGDTTGIARTLESMAALCAARAQPERAVQLAGAASAIRERLGEMQSPMERARMNRWLTQLRQALGSEAISEAWEAGRATSLEEAVELAPAETPRPPARRKRSPKTVPQNVTVLSPRQRQVAALLARDLSNQQIAGQLVITERTVAAHVEHILDKLGFASRHQIGAWAIERGLLN